MTRSKRISNARLATRAKRALVGVAVVAGLAFPVIAQSSGGLDPAQLLKPLADSWPSYSGDYTGRRYSALTQVNQSTVKNLTLAWTMRVTAGMGNAGAGGGGGRRGGGGG